MCVGAVEIGVEIAAAREDQSVEHAEGLLERVLARGHDQRAPARVLDGADVVERHQRRLLRPDAPPDLLGVRGDADQRPHPSDSIPGDEARRTCGGPQPYVVAGLRLRRTASDSTPAARRTAIPAAPTRTFARPSWELPPRSPEAVAGRVGSPTTNVLVSTVARTFLPSSTTRREPPRSSCSRGTPSCLTVRGSGSMQRAVRPLVSSAWMNGSLPPPSYRV